MDANGKITLNYIDGHGQLTDSIDPTGKTTYTYQDAEANVTETVDGDGAGLICLGIKGAETGKVYYWDQWNEPLDEDEYLADYGVLRPPEAMFQNVYLIAESFEDFLQRLEVKTD